MKETLVERQKSQFEKLPIVGGKEFGKHFSKVDLQKFCIFG